MKEYDRIQIQEICTRICSGGTPKSTVKEYYGGTIPWLNTKEVNFNRIHSTEKTITNKGLENSSAKWIDENAVIVAMYGATAGKSAISKIPLTTNQACCNLIMDPNKADYRFVYYALYNDYNRLASLANGGAQQNLNAMQIKEFDIPYPSLEEQTAIADFLSALDDKIEINRQINDNLEQQAHALYKSWFVDFEPFKNGEFIDSELGIIPEGWRVGELSEITNITSGKRPTTKSDYPTSIDKVPVLGASGIMAYTADNLYDIPILIIGRVGTLGIVQKIDAESWPSDNTLVILSKNYHFVYFNLKSIDYQAINRGSTQPLITQSDIKQQMILIPQDEVLMKFEENVNILDKAIKNNNKAIKNLEILRDTLLPKLMSGELKINEIDC